MNILSIDFDIIMYPCIKLYNDKVGGESNPTELWRYLEHEYELENFINYDAKYLLKVAKILKQVIDDGAKLIPIQEHQEIVDYLKERETYQDERYNIYNIDFHHDLWYREEDKNMILSFDKYNCSNWLGYLLMQDKTESCHWVCAGNSGGCPDKFEGKNTLETKTRLMEFEVEDLKFDYVFFCLSPQWIPYQFHHLYQLLVEMNR